MSQQQRNKLNISELYKQYHNKQEFIPKIENKNDKPIDVNDNNINKTIIKIPSKLNYTIGKIN